MFKNAIVGLGMMLAAGSALAEESVERDVPSIDVGLSTGWNAPAGVYGLEAEYRLLDYVSAGVGVGSASWGYKVTPQLRLYPFTADLGLFAELGASINLGSESEASENGNTQLIVQDTVTTLNGALGWRIDFANRWGWIALRAGYSYSLSDTPYHAKDGSEVAGFAKTVMDAITPGGPTFGIAGGVAFM
jgi:hypothetical protein